MRKKFAPPASPAEIAAAQAPVPQNWRDAFAQISERMLRALGKQAAQMRDLSAAVDDLRGVVDAGTKARADLGVQVEALSTRIERETEAARDLGEVMTAGVKLLGEEIASLRGVHEAGAAEAGRAATAVAGLETRLCGLEKGLQEVSAQAGRIGEAIDAGRETRALADDLAGKVHTLEIWRDETRVHLDVLDRADGAISNDVVKLHNDMQARVVAVEAGAQDIGKRVGAVEADLARFGDRCADTAGRVEALDDIISEIGDSARQAHGRLDAFNVLVGEHNDRIGAAEAAAARAVREVEDHGGAIDGLRREISAVSGEAADTLRRVTIALGELPAGMMIDGDGDLVRVNRAGDMTKLGRVVAAARDGRDAADIVSVRMEGERMIFTRSDRSEFGCAVALPAPPPVPVDNVDPTTLGYLSKDTVIRARQVEDMVASRASGKTYKSIAQKYNVSERQVVRMIKEYKK